MGCCMLRHRALHVNAACCRAGPRKRLRTSNTSWGTANGQQLERELERSLREFVRLRTVSSDASLREDCFRGAKFLASLLESLGASLARITFSIASVCASLLRVQESTCHVRRRRNQAESPV